MIKRVLNVDDDELTLTIGEMMMHEVSFAKHVDTASNGKKALEYFANIKSMEEAPDIIFLDLNMPVLDGWQFLEEFEKSYLEKYPDIHIVVLSSSIDPKELQKANDHRLIKRFIQKPLSTDILIEIKNEWKNAA